MEENKHLTSRQRRELFLKMAIEKQPEGVTVGEVYESAKSRGDQATQEAYYNIARRLAHRALLVAQENSSGPTRYRIGAPQEEQWLQEEELAEIIDPDYPLLGMVVWREAIQQVNDIPQSVWIELRERLSSISARKLFYDAIISYCDDFDAQISDLAEHSDKGSQEYAKLHKEAEATLQLLIRIIKYGLGISSEAVNLPASLDFAIRDKTKNPIPSIDKSKLYQEIERRVEDNHFITNSPPPVQQQEPLVGGVDGSTRGGLLSLSGEDGDFNIAYAPLVNINTAVGQINRSLEMQGRLTNVFVRLPERPEDMQRQENRHTVMAKLMYSDLSDSQYMHAVWNAMDLVEIRATLRLMRRWITPENQTEIPPVDIIFRDGTVTPQDRDFYHYKEIGSYGQIVRDMIDLSWEMALRSREDQRSICGVVKNTQLSFYGPVLNWYACQLAKEGNSQINAWPIESMNLVPDQVLITRVLTAGRIKEEEWKRTCIVLRPFHALTNFSRQYSRTQTPIDRILAMYQSALNNKDAFDQDEQVFWDNFQGKRDPYVRMLQSVQYGSFFLAAIPRLDNKNLLPRFEILIPSDTDEESPSPWDNVNDHLNCVLAAIDNVGFDVAAEHNMFLSEPKLDILPRILLKVHDTVKIWASELLSRVQEYVGYHLTRNIRNKRIRGVKVRPFSRRELETLYQELRREREQRAGAGQVRSINQ